MQNTIYKRNELLKHPVYPHTVFKTFYWGQLVEIRRLGLEERHEISQLSCQYL